jgi:hypothetical protein
MKSYVQIQVPPKKVKRKERKHKLKNTSKDAGKKGTPIHWDCKLV